MNFPRYNSAKQSQPVAQFTKHPLTSLPFSQISKILSKLLRFSAFAQSRGQEMSSWDSQVSQGITP